MSNQADCDWCNKVDLEWRVIHDRKLCVSFVSKPWFRKGHCLVIPKKHAIQVSELTDQENQEVMDEIGALSNALDNGFGTGVIQKYMPLQSENGVKMDHLHFHVFPRFENEELLFPVPVPNSFAGFYFPTDEEIKKCLEYLKSPE